MIAKYDVIIIGGGNAGFGVSSVAHEAGKSIAFVERGDFGGTCPNRGCTPKKFLVAAAQSLHEIERARVHGIETGAPRLDWGRLIRRQKSMIAHVPGAMSDLAARRGDIYRGDAKFVGPNTIRVDGHVLEGEDIVIATGSTPRVLPIPGAEHLITSDDVLSLETRPDEVVFIGGGVIAMEFSHVYARAGAKVTILEAMPRLLPQLDEDLVTAARAESERIGIRVKTGVDVREIRRNGDRFEVHFHADGVPGSVEADRVVNGAGRVANVEHLDLEVGNVRHEGPAIEADEFLRSTSNPSVWVCGDALTRSAQLSPVATYEGRMVGRNIVSGLVATPDYSVLPSSVYTVPAIATVGLTERTAKEKGLNVNVTVSDMTGWFSGKAYAETAAFAKVLVDQDRDLVVGAHMLGHNGEDLIHHFAMAMRYAIPASSLREDIFAFPTFSADIRSMF